ncbi:MAG: alpha/beta fold hydrolase, partial [Nitrosopumilus sp.]|nr:alpha/beta fold hydrolase [Nitrosopumilus sp.]
MKDSKDTDNPLSVYTNFAIKSFDFQSRYGLILFNSWLRAIESANNLQESTGKKIQDNIRSTFDAELRINLEQKEFSKSLSALVDSFAEFALVGHHDKLYRYLETLFSNYDNMIEPIRDTINRTPSEIIPMDGTFEVHHYKTDSPQKFKTPILIVGSLINRHYVLDLLPETSIIRHFQQLGFDVYATDWRMPVIKDEDMPLAIYAHDYLENAVDKVEEVTGSRNVTLFGYCWGGILSLIYSAMHPKDVKNLILHATPADFGKPPTVLESWIKDLDVKKFVDTFGNVPSSFLNIAFILRNPLEASLKY